MSFTMYLSFIANAMEFSRVYVIRVGDEPGIDIQANWSMCTVLNWTESYSFYKEGVKTTYLCTLGAHSVWVKHKVCKLLGPVAHIQAPVFAFGILVLEVLQLFHNTNVADELLDNLRDSSSQMQQGQSPGQVLLH